MKKKKIWTLTWRKSVFVWLLMPIVTIIIISVCSQTVINNKNGKTQTFKSPSIPCHLFKHEMGETCVPQNPQRIVVLAHTTLANVLALGVKPMGITGSDLPLYLKQASDIQVVGDGWKPDFEKILLLKPDLILGKGYHRTEYNPLSQIAPTVLLEWNGTPSWKQHLEDVAKVLNKTDQAKSLMQNYYQRLEDFKLKMGDRLKNFQISYIDILVGYIWCDVKNSFAGTILEDAGLQRPLAQKIVTKGGYITFGLETMQADADGDVIFTSHWMDEDGQKALKNTQNNPLWQKLKAVQQNQVYVVNRHLWRGSNILAAHAVIDDLFDYLIKKDNKNLLKSNNAK
jgi:iron complex transport system substrate-binding protein